MFVEQGDDPREVQQRSAQAVDLVDDHAIDFSGTDVIDQRVERRPIHVTAGESAIVVAGW